MEDPRTAVVLEPFEGLEGLTSAVAAIGDPPGFVQACGADPLGNGLDWLQAYADAFPDPLGFFGWLARAEPGGEVVGLAAFRHEPSRGPLALPRAILLQDGTYDSDYIEPLIQRGYEGPFASALIEALAGRREVQAVVLSGVPDASPVRSELVRALDARGLATRDLPQVCLRAELCDDFETFLNGLRSRMRSKVRQAIRRAEESHATVHAPGRADPAGGGQGDLDGADLTRELEALYRLHTLRWNAVGQAGSFEDARRRAFYGRLATNLNREGGLRLYRMDVEGRPVAAQMGVVRDGNYYQIQEGYDPAEERFRPGIALRAHAIQALIQEGVRGYDFMAGESGTKRDWGGEERACATLTFALPRVRARAVFAVRSIFP